MDLLHEWGATVADGTLLAEMASKPSIVSAEDDTATVSLPSYFAAYFDGASQTEPTTLSDVAMLQKRQSAQEGAKEAAAKGAELLSQNKYFDAVATLVDGLKLYSTGFTGVKNSATTKLWAESMRLRSKLILSLEAARQHMGVMAFAHTDRPMRLQASASRRLPILACNRLLVAIKEEGGVELPLFMDTEQTITTNTILHLLCQVDPDDRSRFTDFVLGPLRQLQLHGWYEPVGLVGLLKKRLAQAASDEEDAGSALEKAQVGPF